MQLRLPAGLALALVATALLPTSAAAQAERFALVVGSNLGGVDSGPLYFAELDAERVADVLMNMGGVPSDHLILLRTPTQRRLEGALEELGEQVANLKVRPGGHATVFFYFSGHADPDAIQLGRQSVPYTTLRRALEATGADVRLIFIDSCHAGGASRTKGASRAPSFLDAHAEVDARGEVLITSSAADELSQESDEIGGSYFTHYLLSALRGAADTSEDGEVTLDEAYRYVFHRTVAHTSGTRAGVQHPGFDYDLSGSGDLVMTTLGSKGAVLRFDERQSGRFLIFDDDRDRFVAEVQATPGRPTRLMVEAGTYRIQRRGRDSLAEQVLTLPTGGESSVDVEAMTAVPYAEDATKGAIRRARRAGGHKEIAIVGRVGVQAFMDSESRKSLVPPMPIWGAEVDFRGFLGPGASIRADLTFGTGEHEPYSDVPTRMTQVQAGLGLYLAPRIPRAPTLRPYAGGRIGVLWLHREFGDPLVQDEQDYFTGTPGFVFGLTLAPSRALRLGLEGRTQLVFYIDDDADEQRMLGYFEGIFSVGFAL